VICATFTIFETTRCDDIVNRIDGSKSVGNVPMDDVTVGECPVGLQHFPAL